MNENENQNTNISFENLLKEYLKTFNLTINEIIEISSKFYPLYLKKGDAFCKINYVSKEMGILIDGLLYAYYETVDFTKKVSRFFYLPDNFIVSSFESFSLKVPSNETIKVLEDCFLLCISRDDLEYLYNEIPTMNFIGRQIAEHSYIRTLRRFHSLQAIDKKQRVKEYFQEQPHLFNKVKRQHLASYLGVNRNMISEVLKKE